MAQDDQAFRAWYARKARELGLDPDPDAPEHRYDYRAAFRAGAEPDKSGHWPSQFKQEGHPTEVVGGINTRTGERVPGAPQASEAELVRQGWDAATARRMSQGATQPDPADVLRQQPRTGAAVPPAAHAGTTRNKYSVLDDPPGTPAVGTPAPPSAPSAPAPATMPGGKPNKYSVLDTPDQALETHVRITQQTVATEGVDPQKHAEALRIAQASGLPPSVVLRDFDKLRAQFPDPVTSYSDVVHRAPYLSRWLTDPNNAKLLKQGQDELAQMGALEWFFTAPGRAVAQQINRARYAEIRAKGMFTPLSTAERDAMESYKYNAERDGDLAVSGSFFNKAWTGLYRLATQYAPAAKYGIAGAITAGGVGAAVGSVVPGAGTVAGFMQGARVGGRAGMLYGTVKSTATQEAAETYDELLTTKDETGRLMDPDVAKVAAMTVGGINGMIEIAGVEALIGRIPGLDKLTSRGAKQAMKEALKNPTVRAGMLRLAKNYIGGISEEIAVEVAERGVSIAGAEMAKWASGESFYEETGRGKQDVWDDMVRTAFETVPEFAFGMAPGPMMSFAQDVQKARQAERSVTFFEALGEGAKDNPVLKRGAGDAFQRFAEDALENGPIKTLYQSTDAWNAYWGAKGINPAEMAAKVTGDPNALDKAADSGTLVIPTARYATVLAGTEHNAYFINELRLGDPDAMNGREAEEFKAQVEAVQARIKAEKERRAQTPEERALADIKVGIAGQLGKVGVPRETAETMGTFFAGVGRLIQRAGFDAQEGLAPYGVQVERAVGPRAAQPSVEAAGTRLTQDAPAGQPAATDEEIPGLAALEEQVGTASIQQLDAAEGIVANASGESSASFENIQRERGMKDAGRQFVVYDRAGRRRVLVVDGVDYKAQPGETYGVETPEGFELREDRGGRVPDAGRSESRVGQVLKTVLGQAEPLAPVPAGQRVEGMPGAANAAGERAVFVGYQRGYKSMPTHALYNIEGGENDGSTVGVERLQELNIPVPPTPPMLEYNQRILATSAPLRQWFGESVVVDEQGDPLVVYHGTTRVFTSFDSEQANPESHFGAGFYFSNNPADVGENYATVGPDLAGRIEQRAEQLAQELEDDQPELSYDERYEEGKRIARAEVVEHDGMTMPVFLKIERPAELGGEHETQLTYEIETDDETGDITGEHGTLLDFVAALRAAAARFEGGDIEPAITKIFEQGIDGISLNAAIEIVRSDEDAGYFTGDEGELIQGDIIRQALERAGYDGIIDRTVDLKFGSQRRIGTAMAGMDEDTVHYIVFRPTQIKSAVGNRGTFDPAQPNILFQDAIEPSPASHIFWSKLTRTVEASKTARGTGKQWKGEIANSKLGKNKDEFALAKIEDLDDATKYTKAEVLAYIAQNAPRVGLIVLGEEGTGDYNPDDAELDEDEVNERATEIHDEMVDEAMNDVDWEDYTGHADYIEDTIEDEEEVDVREEIIDEDGNPTGEFEETTETRTVERTVYYPALRNGMHEVPGQRGYHRWEFRRGTHVIADAEGYDTEDEAEEAARDRVTELQEEDFIRERVHEGVREGVDWGEAVEEAERQLRNEGRFADRQEGQLRTRYSDFGILDPAPEAGSYREIFLTASNVAQGETIEGPDLFELSLAMFGEPDYNKLDELQKEVVDAAHKNHQTTRVVDYEWNDGHDKYRDIENPIVRMRLGVRMTLGEPMPAAPVDAAIIQRGKDADQILREMAADDLNATADTDDFDAHGMTTEPGVPVTFTPETVKVDRWVAQIVGYYGRARSPDVRDRVNELEGRRKAAETEQRRAETPVRGPGKRILFIEEVQPPHKDEMAKMPPIFAKNWRDLAFKFLLRYAVDQGFDTMAWVTGQQQADHWSLDKKVRSIVTNVTPSAEAATAAGTEEAWTDARAAGIDRIVQVNLPDGRSPRLEVSAKGIVVKATSAGRLENELKGQPLAAIMGEEIAAKVMAHAGDEALTLEGKGLRVGGKGLKRLYDFDFKSTVRDLPAFKKHGGTVGSVTIQSKVKWHVETPEEVSDEELGRQGITRPTPTTHFVMDNAGTVVKMFESRDTANDYVYTNLKADTEQPAVFITPEVADAVRGGQALFQGNRYRPTSPEELAARNEELQAVIAAAQLAAPAGTWVSAHVTPHGEVHLAGIQVPDVARGKGAGRAVLHALTEFADEHNMQMSLAAEPGRHTLRRLYSKNGFVENGRSGFYDASSTGAFVRPSKQVRARRTRGQGPTKRGPRGALSWYPGERQMTISLFEHADLSTFLHETGHFYLEVFGDLIDKLDALDPATLTPSQQQVKADYQTILTHLGVKSRAELTADHHETFAKSFETYLMEGKAPSLELREAFSRVRAWFVGIYRSLKALGAPLTPEVRKVFDRLLASDEAIAEAEQAGELAPMWLTREEAGMTPERFALYRQTIADASAAGTEALDAQLMAEVQREQEAQYKARKAEIRAEVTAETHAMPVYKAISAMARGKHPNGQPLTEGQEAVPLKLSKKLLIEQHGDGILRALPKTIYSVEGGVAANVVAAQFGFDSGDALLIAVSEAPQMQKRIIEETERRTLQEHGSLLLDGSVHEAAQMAAASEQRDAVLREELRALARKQEQVQAFERGATKAATREAAYERRWFEAEAKLRIAIAEGRQQVIIDALRTDVQKHRAASRSGPALIRGAVPPSHVLTDQARKSIAGTKVADLNPMLYWANAKRASKAAVEAAARQDFPEAIRQKHRELISLSLYRETVKAKQEVEKRVKAAKALGTPQAMAKLRLAGETYHDQVAGVLDRFEFATVSMVALERRAALWRWVQGLESQGQAVNLPPELLDETRRINYKQLTVEELVGITDGLKQIVHLAQFKNRLLKNDRTRNLNKLAASLTTTIYANKAVQPRTRRDRPNSVELGRMARSFLAAHRKLSFLLRMIDGYVDGGPMWEAIMRPLNAAGAREADMTAQATRRLHDIIEAAYPKGQKRDLYKRSFVPAVNQSLSKMERIMYALNWGNEGNRDRVLRSEKWNKDQVQAVLDTLTPDDAKLVQDIFDMIGSYWPEIAAKQERVTGQRPEKVEASPFTIGAVQLKGGYFPLKYDDRLSAKADAMKDLEKANLAKSAAFVHATTRRGHVEARAETGDDPVRLDFGVIDEHLMQVIHDLTHHEALIDIQRVLSHHDVTKAILETHGDIVFKAMKHAIRDAAFGDIPATNGFERALNHTRAGVTIVGLAWSLTTPLMQLLGYANSTQRLRPKWMAKGFYRALGGGTPRSMTQTVEWVYEVSPMMKTRGLTQQRELNEIRNTVGVYSGKLATWMDDILTTTTLNLYSRQGVADSYFYMIGKMQQMVDVPTWLGAYEKAMSAGGSAEGDEARAIAIADQAVLDTQGGGQMKDMALVQRGAPALKIFTSFYTAGSVLFNQAAEVAGTTKYNNAASVGRALTDYLLLFIVPASASYFIREALRSGDDDEPLWEALTRENLSYLVGTMVGFRELSGGIQDYFGYEGPAGARVFAAANRVIKQVSQGEMDAAQLRAINELSGIIFHYPSTQVWKTANGMAAIAEGRTRNPMVLITGPEK